KRLDNLQSCLVDVIQNGIPGDVIETGVWRGGASIFMRAGVKAYGGTSKIVWVAGLFSGGPKPDASEFPAGARSEYFTYDELAVSIDQVKSNFERYSLLDEQVRFLKGWFKDTLPTAPIDKLAILRLDGDMYESTIQALTPLYPKLQPGGHCIVDDY